MLDLRPECYCVRRNGDFREYAYHCTSVLWGEVYATDNVWIDNSEISQGAYISDSVTIRDSLVCGQCRIFGHALIDQHSMIVAAQGLTPDHQLLLQIYDAAKVSASRIVHQAQIYGDAVVRYAFIEHRAEVLILPVLKVMKRTTSGYAIALKSTVTRR